MNCKKTCDKYFRAGESACEKCSCRDSASACGEGDGKAPDADGCPSEDGDCDDAECDDDFDEVEADEFGNTGKNLYWVPINFRIFGYDFKANLRVAADDEESACERAEAIDIFSDILDDCENADDVCGADASDFVILDRDLAVDNEGIRVDRTANVELD